MPPNKNLNALKCVSFREFTATYRFTQNSTKSSKLFLLDTFPFFLILLCLILIDHLVERIVEYTNCFSEEGWNHLTTRDLLWHKTSDGWALVMLVLWGMQNIPSLPSLQGSLWLVVVAPVKSYLWVKRICSIFKLCNQITNTELNC